MPIIRVVPYRYFLAVMASALVWGVGPSSAAAAVCADHPNQRSAQEAQDTRDADGDGIYCEALPCPCLKPGQGGGGQTAKPHTPAKKRAKKPAKKKVKPPAEIDAEIVRVIDGDTVRAKTSGGGFLTVRLIGVDSPEKTALRNGSAECGGLEAAAALEEYWQRTGPEVTLVTDSTQDRYDRYGRLLAYVEPLLAVEPDPITYQEFLLASGWSDVYVYESRFKRHNRFIDSAAIGSVARAGVWSLCEGDFHRPLKATS